MEDLIPKMSGATRAEKIGSFRLFSDICNRKAKKGILDDSPVQYYGTRNGNFPPFNLPLNNLQKVGKFTQTDVIKMLH